MKKKIVGIFVCMLLIATTLPVVGALNNNIAQEVFFYNELQDLQFKSEPLKVGLPSIILDDEYFYKQWSLNNNGQSGGTADCDIDALEAWNIEAGDPNVVIAIIDSGVDYNHPDLADNIWINEDETADNGIDDDENGYVDDIRGWNFVSDNNNPLDGQGHGTLCSGVAAAVGNNGVGISGVCWNCKIMPVQTMDERGSGNWDNIALGIRYAADNGADVISISLGGYTAPNLLKDAVDLCL